MSSSVCEDESTVFEANEVEWTCDCNEDCDEFCEIEEKFCEKFVATGKGRGILDGMTWRGFWKFELKR